MRPNGRATALGLGLTTSLSFVLVAACTGGQSGHEGAGLDGPADVHDAGPGLGSGGGPGAGVGGGPGYYANCGLFGNCGPGAAPIGPCACEDFVGRIALRGVVTSFEDGRVAIQTSEVLGGDGCMPLLDAGGGCPIVRGDSVSASWDGRMPCAARCADISVGEQVLALYDAERGVVGLAPAQEQIQLGDGKIQDEEANLLVVGGGACVEAVEHASGGKVASVSETQSDAQSDAGVDVAPDAGPGPGDCTPEEGAFDAGPLPDLHDPTPLDSDHVCADSGVAAPLDCLDVCGALFSCDPSLACDDCLERCAASPMGPVGGDRCLSRVVYLIDEEGCDSMLRAYRAYLLEASCGE